MYTTPAVLVLFNQSIITVYVSSIDVLYTSNKSSKTILHFDIM